MNVSTYGTVLFLHIAAVIAGLMLAAVLHAGLLMTRRAQFTAQCRPWMPVIRVLEPLLPVAALIILGTGGWLLHLSGGEFSWGDGWVVVSLAALAVIEVVGGLLAPRREAWQQKLAEASDGPVTPEVRKAGLDPALWCFGHGATAGFIGIVFLMAAKPATGWSIAIEVAVIALGAATAVPFVFRPANVAVPGPRVPSETSAPRRPGGRHADISHAGRD